MEKKILLVVSILLTALLLLWREPSETVIRKERLDLSSDTAHLSRDVYFFESGNRAEVTLLREQHRSDRYKKYAPTGELIEEGRFINGKFDPDYDDTQRRRDYLLGAAYVLWLLTFIFYFRRISSAWQNLKDRIRNARAVPFSLLPHAKQLELIKANNDCPTCLASPDLTFLREEKVSGMRFIYCHCSKCGEEKKIRIK